MKHFLEQKVYYADTDAYAVTWHGSYLRWMEIGRVEFCEKLGLNLVKLKELNMVFAVSNLNIRYKAPARINEEIIVETEIEKITPITITFLQTIKNKKTESVYTRAEVQVVAITNDGKLYKRIPDEVMEALKRGMICND